MAHLAAKAFAPAKTPFNFLHVDTGHNFSETIEFRDRFVEKLGAQLIVGLVQDSIERGTVQEETGPDASRNGLQSVTLLESIEREGFDACLGGGRRDEEKARAKERFFSHRDGFGQWDPKNQRPELWNLYNGFINTGQHIRVFPLSNWTELDIWQYIMVQGIEIPSIYFAHRREVFEREGLLMAHSDFLRPQKGEKIIVEKIRFRTVGDMTITSGVKSDAETLEQVIAEIASTRISERGGSRADDRTSDAAMEDRKREGYF